jgi:hypothetical protein
VYNIARIDMVKKRFHRALLLLQITVLLPTLSGFDRYISFWIEPHLNDMQAITQLMDELKSRGLHNAFVSEWQVLWQLNYLGNEEMYFRYLLTEDRIERYVEKVNMCYLSDECITALTGSLWPLRDMQHVEGWNDRIIKVNERFYLMEEPEDKFLLKRGFELPQH